MEPKLVPKSWFFEFMLKTVKSLKLLPVKHQRALGPAQNHYFQRQKPIENGTPVKGQGLTTLLAPIQRLTTLLAPIQKLTTRLATLQKLATLSKRRS